MYGHVMRVLSVQGNFKVVDFCKNRQLIYDLLLVINYCGLSFYLSPFQREIVNQSTHPSLSTPVEGSPSNFAVKLTPLKVETAKNRVRVILALVVLSQYTRVTYDRRRRQTDNISDEIAKLCNAIEGLPS